MRIRLVSFAAFIMGLATFLSCGRAEPAPTSTVWEGLRSAIIYIRVPKDATQSGTIDVSWTPAWIADSQRERLYWYGPAGKLLQRVEIERSHPRGTVSLKMPSGPGDYRLVIPGYSFRKYKVAVPQPFKSVIEPEKLHFSMEIPTGNAFWTGPVENAHLNLKSHNHTAALQVTSTNGNASITHSASQDYQAYETLPLVDANQPIKLSISDGGKFSFWLDGAPNLFSQSAAAWFEPQWKPGDVVFSVTDEVIGETTKLGTYAEFAPLPQELKELIQDAQPAIVHTYIFEDVMEENSARDSANHRALANFGIEQSYGLLSRTERDSLPKSAASSSIFLDSYIRGRFSQNLPLDVIAFVDEPNLRYRDYDAYETYHLTLSETVRTLNDTLGLNVKISAPESSRMINGPTNKPRRFQSGFSWTEKLLLRHWDTVDVISWHMWQYRYLEALDQYPETIESVAEMNARLARARGKQPKALSISQTNLGSGPNTSAYQQNTYYAGLWWASVVTQSIATGKLDHLIWFKAVDEGPYGKGLLMLEDGRLVRKPIAEAMIFINKALLPKTLATASSAHDVDIAAMHAPSGEVSLLCVNKSRRDYSVRLETGAITFDTAEILLSDGTIDVREINSDQQRGDAPLRLPAESICRLKAAAH